MKKRRSNTKRWALPLAAVILALVFWKLLPGAAVLMVFLAANCFVSYLKRFTSAAPVDIDVLAAGGAVLASSFGWMYGLLLALIGPPISESVQGEISEFVWIKMVSVLLTVIAASILGDTSWQLLAAVAIGLVLQFALMFAFSGDTVFNFVRRLTNLLTCGYIIFFIVPLIG